VNPNLAPKAQRVQYAFGRSYKPSLIMNGMDLRHLSYFVAVAEEESFTRAARRLYVSQPALSQRVRKLEDELGARLFERRGRDIELTEAGRALLEGAYGMERAINAAREAAGVGAGRLRVGFVEYANHAVLPELLGVFRRLRPDAELEYREGCTAEQVGALREGEIDVGFVGLPLEDRSGLLLQRVARVELMAALPEGHRLATRRAVTLADLAEESFLLFPRDFNPGYYDYLVGRCHEAGFQPEIVRGADRRPYSRATLDRMVASGLGVDLHVPAATHPNSAPPPGVVLKPLRGRAPALELAAAWRRGHGSGILREFLRVVREVAADEAGGAR
jgi:DNA-binding transcriptional LysR family regulator